MYEGRKRADAPGMIKLESTTMYIFSLKWTFALLGFWIMGIRGFIGGYLLGWLMDSLLSSSRSHIHFTTDEEEARKAFQRYQQYQRDQQRQYSQYHQSPEPSNRLSSAYDSLGISPNASDEEVRQAYRNMAMRFHPDRMANSSEMERRQAEHLFKKATEARDRIFTARGMK